MAAPNAPSTAPPPPPPPAKLAVAWECTVPASCAGLRLHEALQGLQPDQFPTMTAAKMAVRRRTIQIDGQQAANPSTTLAGGELLQCVQRAGAAVQLSSGDRLARAVAADAARIAAAGVQLQVLYEDEHMACVIKPQGVPCDVPPGRSSGSGSEGGLSASSSRSGSTAALSEARCGPAVLPSVFTLLAHTLQPSQQVGALRRPRHVHRLDEPTGGLLLVAKTRAAQQKLSSAFGQRQVHKRYRALVWGRLEGRGLVTYTLDGRHCETEYAAVQHTAVDLQRLDLGDPAAVEAAIAATAAVDGAAGAAAAAAAAEASQGIGAARAAAASNPNSGSSPGRPSSAAVWITTVDLWPHTGRKHQLRRHMALLGHPLVGEPRYSFGYAQQRLQSGQEIAAEDHRRLPADAAPDAAMAGAAKSAAAVAATVPQPVPDALGPERALLRLAAAKTAAQRSFELCLWALELVLDSHPATDEPLYLQMPEPPLFAEVRAALAGARGEQE